MESLGYPPLCENAFPISHCLTLLYTNLSDTFTAVSTVISSEYPINGTCSDCTFIFDSHPRETHPKCHLLATFTSLNKYPCVRISDVKWLSPVCCLFSKSFSYLCMRRQTLEQVGVLHLRFAVSL